MEKKPMFRGTTQLPHMSTIPPREDKGLEIDTSPRMQEKTSRQVREAR